MTRPTSDDLLVMTIEDVAEILQVSKSTTYQLARSEQLRSIHVGQRLRILRTDFVALSDAASLPEVSPCFC